MNYLQRFRVAPGSKVKLKALDPSFTDGHQTDESAAEGIAQYQKKLRELQDLLYAERQHFATHLPTGGKAGGCGFDSPLAYHTISTSLIFKNIAAFRTPFFTRNPRPKNVENAKKRVPGIRFRPGPRQAPIA